jgi:hypothetical protein
MIHCKPKVLSFCIRAALGIYTPALAAQRLKNSRLNVQFI